MEFGFLKIKYKIHLRNLLEFKRLLQMEKKGLIKRVIEGTKQSGIKNICTENEYMMEEHEIDVTEDEVKQMDEKKVEALIKQKV